MSFAVPPLDPVEPDRFERGLRMGARAMGVDVQEAEKRYETLTLSTWARLCLLAEAVDRLAKDGSPLAASAAAAARAAMPTWLQRDALAVPLADSPGEPWRQWQISAKAVVSKASKDGKLAALRAAMLKAAKAADAVIAPAANVSGVASVGLSAARKYLAAVVKGTLKRVRRVKPSGKGAAAAAGAAAGAGAAAAGAGAAAAGASAGREIAAPGGLLGAGGPLDVRDWPFIAKLALGVGVGFVAYRFLRPRLAAPAAVAPARSVINGKG